MTARARRALIRTLGLGLCVASTAVAIPAEARATAPGIEVIVRLAPPPLALVAPARRQLMGIGGDPIVGSSFIDILQRFEDDAQTELVVMVGEIGGAEEERAAEFIADHMSKPVVAYIAGFSAPPGKTMGHAGAIISGSAGTAQGKKEALEARGIPVGINPTEAARIAAERVRST